MIDARHEKLPLVPVLILWAVISAIMIFTGWEEISTRGGWDPDDKLRMVQLRDFLSGQSWFDISQYRMNGNADGSPGAPMHWSRFVELPLAIIIVLLAPLIGQPAAEMVAGAAVPLIGIGLVAVMVGQIATRLGSREAGVIAALITLISPALLMQFRPMRIDHHGWQILMAVLALWTMFRPQKKANGILLGLALAIWLHISLEGAPLTAAFFLLLGWRWVFDKAQGKRLLWTIISFATGSLTLYIATQSAPFAATLYCDTISPPHIAAIAVAAAIMVAAILYAPVDWRYRMGAAALAGTGALGAMFFIAPECSAGAFGTLDPQVRDYWYVHINEGLPIWHQQLKPATSLLAAPLCGLIAILYMLGHAKRGRRSDLRVAAFFMIYSMLVSILVFRTVSVASAFAIAPVAIFIMTLYQHYRRSKVPVRRIGLVAAMLALLVPGAVAGQLIGFAKPRPEIGQTAVNDKKCQSVGSVAALAAIPNARFLAPFDMGPTILLTSENQVLASSHHRNETAMRDHISIFLSASEKARPLIVQRGITHIAVCADEAEMNNYEKNNETGLWSQLNKGNTPDWLEAMQPVGDDIKLWRVK